jgi:uncharacterized damage-inducible protein DinB
MELHEYFRRQFAYDAWANQQVLAALQPDDTGFARSLELFAHIISAERLWLERIRLQPQSLAVWPELSLAQATGQSSEVNRLWRDYLEPLSSAGLAQLVSYKNSKGESYTSTVADILTHVLLHSAYHRGQIASHMRANALNPAYTDFIHAARQGFIE